MTENDEDDWVVTEDAYPALIDRRTFQAAQARRRERRKAVGADYRQGAGGGRSDYLLTGLIVCSHCGHHWQGYTQWKGRRRKDGERNQGRGDGHDAPEQDAPARVPFPQR